MLRKMICILMLSIASQSYAHVLNMTELRLSGLPNELAILEVQIDLGQSLMSADAYWRAVQEADKAKQAELLKAPLSKLVDGLTLRVDGSVMPLRVVNWHIQAGSLGAIENPLTPQMASITLEAASPITARQNLSVAVTHELEVPWPVLLRVDAPGVLPVSRLLTAESRQSRLVIYGVGGGQSQAGPWIGLALEFQKVVPSLTWLAVGFQHILPLGLDHIVFVLGLFFLSTKLSVLLVQVSAFTVAHSITLGMATLGWIVAPSSIVEPLVAASIVYIAIDNLYSKNLERWRLLVVTLFGLLHGLGFASALNALVVPEESMLRALLLFNLGVEFGQLTVLLLAFIAMGWLRKWSLYRKRVAEPASMTIAGVGLYWLFKRLAF